MRTFTFKNTRGFLLILFVFFFLFIIVDVYSIFINPSSFPFSAWYCSRYPKASMVSSVVNQHKDDIERLVIAVARKYHTEEVTVNWLDNSVIDNSNDNAGFYVDFSWNLVPSCLSQEKAVITISVPSEVDRQQVKDIINADTFFGIPFEIQNV